VIVQKADFLSGNLERFSFVRNLLTGNLVEESLLAIRRPDSLSANSAQS
jgi:hypothetical protein